MTDDEEMEFKTPTEQCGAEGPEAIEEESTQTVGVKPTGHEVETTFENAAWVQTSGSLAIDLSSDEEGARASSSRAIELSSDEDDL
jgi:hypothetical protein